MNWLLHLLDRYGITDSTGRWYAFWSGSGSDIGELALFGAAVTFWRRHSCHVDSPRFCWRPGTHPVDGTPYKTCRRHHPTVPDRISVDHIAAAHGHAYASMPSEANPSRAAEQDPNLSI